MEGYYSNPLLGNPSAVWYGLLALLYIDFRNRGCDLFFLNWKGRTRIFYKCGERRWGSLKKKHHMIKTGELTSLVLPLFLYLANTKMGFLGTRVDIRIFRYYFSNLLLNVQNVHPRSQFILPLIFVIFHKLTSPCWKSLGRGLMTVISLFLSMLLMRLQEDRSSIQTPLFDSTSVIQYDDHNQVKSHTNTKEALTFEAYTKSTSVKHVSTRRIRKCILSVNWG